MFIGLELNSQYLMDSELGAQLLERQNAGREPIWHEGLSVYMNMFAYLLMLDRAENPDEVAVKRSRGIRKIMIDSIIEENARVGAECREIIGAISS
jgi:hypothetical protein